MIITISTHKGGSGKTTIATNLASSIAELHKDKSVLLIDLDGQCGVSISFGHSPKKFINQSILSIIKSDKQLQEVIDNNISNSKNESIDNLSIIYSEPNLRAFDHIINEKPKLKDNLIKLIQYLDKQFDFIIIDTPPTFSSINYITFLESKIIVAPFEAERQNIEGVLNVINEVKKDKYLNKPFVYLLPNKIKDWTSIDKKLIDYIDEVVPKNDNQIIMSSFKIPESTQYKTISAIEKVPLILSQTKNKSINMQKSLMIEISNEILSLTNSHLNFSLIKNKKQKEIPTILLNLEKILNRNWDLWLDKVNEKYKKK